MNLNNEARKHMTVEQKSREVNERRLEILKIISEQQMTIMQIVEALNKNKYLATKFVVESDLGYLTKYVSCEKTKKAYFYKSTIGNGFTLDMLTKGLFGKPVKTDNQFINKLFGYTDKIPNEKHARLFTEKHIQNDEHHRHVKHYASGASLSGEFSVAGV